MDSVSKSCKAWFVYKPQRVCGRNSGLTTAQSGNSFPIFLIDCIVFLNATWPTVRVSGDFADQCS